MLGQSPVQRFDGGALGHAIKTGWRHQQCLKQNAGRRNSSPPAFSAAGPRPAAAGLRCEFLDNLDRGAPSRLSWVLNRQPPRARQTAFHVVGEPPELLRDEGDLWIAASRLGRDVGGVRRQAPGSRDPATGRCGSGPERSRREWSRDALWTMAASPWDWERSGSPCRRGLARAEGRGSGSAASPGPRSRSERVPASAVERWIEASASGHLRPAEGTDGLQWSRERLRSCSRPYVPARVPGGRSGAPGHPLRHAGWVHELRLNGHKVGR